ncbi:Oxoglutarate/iron-dependent dioxygenase - like 10 [Theobroma cacao]|nr:Oxoglutarate/iron-dependent dioxygenase - like 10 [Theobroma cacao]
MVGTWKERRKDGDEEMEERAATHLVNIQTLNRTANLPFVLVALCLHLCTKISPIPAQSGTVLDSEIACTRELPSQVAESAAYAADQLNALFDTSNFPVILLELYYPAVNMASPSILPANVLLSRRVQEMVINGAEPESLYICRDEKEDEDVPSPLAPIPIIDLSLFSSSTLSTKREEELQKLKSALCSWGCFQAIGHGIPSSFLDEIRQVTTEFFEQPMDEKKKYSKGVEDVEGYGGDPTPEEGQFLDWQDRLFLTSYPEYLRDTKFWPESPKSFRNVLEYYTTKMRMVTELVSKSMAKSLQLEENCFLNQFGERAALQVRFNYYPCCQKPEIVLGLKPHADGTGYTIILQDDVEGLQVLKEEHWFTVPTIPNALLVLMGNQMEIMTNGMFKSPVHRVVTNKEKERTSIAVFYTPEKHKEIGPEDGLVNEERPRLFKKVKDYDITHWEYYQRGMRALHTAEI